MDAQVINDPMSEIWQIDASGQIYEAQFAELPDWIAEGSLLPQDKVRRGNLRWIDAQKVPTLLGFFNAKALGVAPPTISTKTVQTSPQSILQTNETNAPKQDKTIVKVAKIIQKTSATELVQTQFCLVHIKTRPVFICSSCNSVFCEECPKKASANVWTCPMCREMCNSLKEVVEKEKQAIEFRSEMNKGFGFADFARAIIYPFKFKISFLFGALIFMVISIGQGAMAIGGSMMFIAALFCTMLANMFTFGILANSVENMLVGKTNQNFMPNFTDFSLWDSVIYPFFLSISVYLASFAAFILLVAVMFFWSIYSFNNPATANKTVGIITPELQAGFQSAQNGSEEINKIKEFVKQQNDGQVIQMDSAEGKNMMQNPPVVFVQELDAEQAEQIMNQTRSQQVVSPIGSMPKEGNSGFDSLAKQLASLGTPLITLTGILGVLGFFYIPVAYIVAAYTQNIASVFNPLIGIDTIKRLGFDYIKILFFSFIILIAGGFTYATLRGFLAPFDLPRIGNIPMLAVGGILYFYLSIVFATMIGFALYRNLDSFKMYQNR